MYDSDPLRHHSHSSRTEDLPTPLASLRRDRRLAIWACVSLLLVYGLTFFMGSLLGEILAGDLPSPDWVDPVYLGLFLFLVPTLPVAHLFGSIAGYRLARHWHAVFASLSIAVLSGIPGVSLFILLWLILRVRQKPRTEY